MRLPCVDNGECTNFNLQSRPTLSELVEVHAVDRDAWGNTPAIGKDLIVTVTQEPECRVVRHGNHIVHAKSDGIYPAPAQVDNIDASDTRIGQVMQTVYSCTAVERIIATSAQQGITPS